MEAKFIVSDITMKTVQLTKLPPSVFAVSKALFLLTCLRFSPPMDLPALSDPEKKGFREQTPSLLASVPSSFNKKIFLKSHRCLELYPN